MKKNENKKIRVATKAIIYDKDGNILTIKRCNKYNRPLTWDLPGGNLDFGEKLEDNLIREIREETGLRVSSLSMLGLIENLDDKDLFRVTVCYTVKTKITKVVLSHEHIAFKWVTPDEFLKLKAYTPHKKFVQRFKSLEIKK